MPVFAQEAEDFGKEVGFAPDLASEPETPPGLSELVKRGLQLKVAPYRPIHPSNGYMEATRRHQGTAVVVEGGSIRTPGLKGYVAGLPFPRPKTGLEVAWDMFYAYMGDDGWIRFRVHWVSKRRGVRRTEEWLWMYLTRATHRTDLFPLPDAATKGIQYASLARAEYPQDKRGTAALFFRYEDPRDQTGFAFVPSMRRPLKMTFGAPGVPWNQTHMLFEDIRGYSGPVEWMEWRLLGQATILAPMHANLPFGPEGRAPYLDVPPYWNAPMEFEPRPVYVLEGRPRFWTSPYSRVVLYVDAESFLVPLKEGYDHKGRLFKVVLNAYNESPDPSSQPAPLALALALDLETGEATVFETMETKANVGLTLKNFTEVELRRLGP